MDQELRGWTERQDQVTAEMAAQQQRIADDVRLLTRAVGNIEMLLAPKISEGPSPLEELLAQLVAQNNEMLTILRTLAQQAIRIEQGMAGGATGGKHPNGNGRHLPP